MNLSQQLARQLDRINDGTVDVTIQLETPHGRLEVKLAETDRLACAFERIRHQGHWLDGLQAGQLRQLGAWITQRVDYLFEPLSAIELDSDTRALQMRSTSPTQQTDSKTYFELEINPDDGITMRRFMKAAGSPRQSIPATVTREVMMRLCDDIISSRDCLCQETNACDESLGSRGYSGSRLPHVV